ncbi:glycosyltransferase [Salegentibacter sp. Hel_I_6]|uniref:glycosyltransferase n=1 Tax=Salegentibacter sp. Hel_I_6 TaxID=1250278 RepID=UPI000563EA48|nr:glycosyltransferase [Salegentibacter sp. Hel_I_6]
MRLLHAIDKMNPERGGVCQAVRTIISGLSKYGVTSEVVCVDSPEEDFIIKSDFKIHALGPSDKYWSYSSKLIPWLRNNFFEYDAIIVHGLWQYPSYAFEKIRKELEESDDFKENLPKIHVMPHGMLDPYFQTAPDRKLKAIRNKLYWELIERKLINNADAILFTCETECLLARVPFKPYHPKEEIVVGLGVEAPPEFIPEMKISFKEQCNGITNYEYILFLSRIHEKKGVDILVEAYADLLNNWEKAKNSATEIPKLVIAGPGLESEYGKKVQNIINKNPSLKENVFLPGMLSGDAKWGAFYGCQAFILPSHQENFGIAIVEAMACGKPVLITNKVNIWREILNSDSGFVEDDNLIGTSNLLGNWWVLDKEKKDEMAKKAKISFQEKFEIHKASRHLLEVVSRASAKIQGVDF